MDTFTVEIRLGNEAMESGADVAEALRSVASQVENGNPWVGETTHNVRDLNGNTVGEWRYVFSANGS